MQRIIPEMEIYIDKEIHSKDTENIKLKYNCNFHSFSIALFTKIIPSTLGKVVQHYKIKERNFEKILLTSLVICF